MKIISWNLNGLMSCVINGSFKPVAALNPDIVCLQEIRTYQTPTIIEGYVHIFNPAQRDQRLHIPQELFNNKLPDDLIYEFEQHCAYLIKKYGLKK